MQVRFILTHSQNRNYIIKMGTYWKEKYKKVNSFLLITT